MGVRLKLTLGTAHLIAMADGVSKTPGEVRLNWVRTGTGDVDTVVLIHAVGYDLTYWDRQIEALGAGYNVVAFDLPGHGRSPGGPQDWSFEKAAAMIASLIEGVSERPVHLVGISFGGMLAQAVVLARPDLVCSLTLAGTASRFSEAARNGMRARAETVRAGGMAAVLQSSLERWFTAETRARRPDLMDRVSKTVLGDDPEVHAAIWEMIAGFDVRERLGEIACPTLVVVGEKDASTSPASAVELAEGIRGARLVVVPDAAHMVTVEAPAAVNAAMREFLSVVSREETQSARG